MDTISVCKLCCQKKARYVCPRCNLPYCSLECYQSQAHTQCSESFYKDCVVEEIKTSEVDTESQKKMVEILQRIQQIDGQFENEDVLDSDDDDEESDEDLAKRLAGVDLDDADQVWAKLTDNEKRQFEELIKSGDVSDIVPQWKPWWMYRERKKCIEDLDALPEEDLNSTSYVPPIKQNIEPLSSLTKVTPSPCTRWNLVNLLAAFSVTARVYNGDHHNSPLEAASCFVSICDNLQTNQVFESPEMAVAAVYMAAVNNKRVEGVDESQLQDDVKRLVEGPSQSLQSDYVLAALSDLYLLLNSAKQIDKETRKSKHQGEFSKKFPTASDINIFSVNNTQFKRYLKKIEFFLSWTKECF